MAWVPWVEGPVHLRSERVAPTRVPGRPQRGPYTGRGARTDGLVGDKTRLVATKLGALVCLNGTFLAIAHGP